MSENERQLELDPQRTALIIQDLQNDVITPGGAFADDGGAEHARKQNVVEHAGRLAVGGPFDGFRSSTSTMSSTPVPRERS